MNIKELEILIKAQTELLNGLISTRDEHYRQQKREPGSNASVRCEQCSNLFSPRPADRARGWGRFCSKRCKAKAQI